MAGATTRGVLRMSLVLAVLCSLLLLLVVTGCHFHLAHEGPDADSHCTQCDLAATFVAVLAVLCLLLHSRVVTRHAEQQRQTRGVDVSRWSYIRPPPALFYA